jgi:hypothetical protein
MNTIDPTDQLADTRPVDERAEATSFFRGLLIAVIVSLPIDILLGLIVWRLFR